MFVVRAGHLHEACQVRLGDKMARRYTRVVLSRPSALCSHHVHELRVKPPDLAGSEPHQSMILTTVRVASARLVSNLAGLRACADGLIRLYRLIDGKSDPPISREAGGR